MSDMQAAADAVNTPIIDTGDDSSVQHWCKELDVGREQLVAAVRKVGSKAADVELYLKGSRSSTNADTTEAGPPVDTGAQR